MPGIVMSGSAKPIVDVDGKAVIYFGGTNYLGMSYNENVILAAQEGLIRWGISSAGSRETTGSAAVHLQLEEKLAGFLQREFVLTCCSGYIMNLVLLQGLKEKFDTCLLDEAAHCSVRDAVAGASMRLATFKHGDLEGLESSLSRINAQGNRALICTDGVLASGEISPIGEYQKLAAEWDSAVLVDDAHGIGVLGDHGRGAVEFLGLIPERIYQTGTLSKAFGCFGGFAAADEPITEQIRTNSTAFIGSTPLPPAIAAAALVSIDIVSSDTTIRKNLARNIRLMKSGLCSLGVEIADALTPIAMFVPGSREVNMKIHRRLLDANVLIPYNFYPGGPEEGFFRMVVTAKHSPEQIKHAIEILGNLIID